ncbi:hypothetical protein SULI_00010 [Saccharolobus solfataricus]|nr:hypothetical protein [Saccharolobus solfataricus]AKA74974.1 hypothetical protein SULB_0002 [Saccharolobus solfataricus]AYN75800.1 hypothetical protein SULC_02925 [Saccharolobus solfataricus]AYP18635.1 hypothetical protein SULA_02925 [Saccharolobus solfataricus]AZF69439.1 hypothetical protein SULG_00010 [Saccharolobus solfataricus]AZF72059.1 hypothetical protein SULH_00010 [Saccharolobus solfataricus]
MVIRRTFIKSTLAVSFSISYLLYLIARASFGSGKLAFVIALLQLYPYFLIEYLPTGQVISLFFQSLLLLLFAIFVLLITYILFSFYKLYKMIKTSVLK